MYLRPNDILIHTSMALEALEFLLISSPQLENKYNSIQPDNEILFIGRPRSFKDCTAVEQIIGFLYLFKFSYTYFLREERGNLRLLQQLTRQTLRYY